MATSAEVKLPKQVEEQAKMAEDFMSALRGEAAEEETGEEEEAEEEEGSEDESEDGTADEGEVETAGDEAEAAGEEEEDADEEEESYRRRYETLQGKYNAEVPRLNDEVRKLKDSIIERLGSIDQKPAADKPPEGDEDTVDPLDERIAALRENFDEELIDFVELLAEKKAKSLVGESMTPVTEKIDSVESAQIESARNAFSEAIDESVEGDWKELWAGKDPAFIEFLDTTEPNGYFTYRELAKKASDNWDANTLSKVFNTYLDSYKTEKPGKAEAKADPKPNRQQQSRVAPERKPVAAEPTADEPKMWTQAEIRQFQEDDRKGKVPKEQADALWNDLLRAPAENRITK